jgi:acetolactate synthase-1/2/3 large subunit
MVSKALVEKETSVDVAVADVLAAAGIDTVFSVVGGHSVCLHPAFDGREDIRMVFLRQETLAGPMAETYGRLTGKPGVFIGQGPWLAGWGWTGIMEAYLSSSPMVLLTDWCEEEPHSLHAPYQSQTGHYGSAKLEQALSSICKQVFTVRTPAEAVAATQLAIKHATSGQPGPVAVLGNFAAWSGKINADSVPRLYETRRYLPVGTYPANAACVTAAAETLRKARTIAIVSGNGVRIGKAQAALKAFAEKVGASVSTTTSGKGTFPETHPLAAGTLGSWGSPTGINSVARADVIVAVGTKLGATDSLMAHPSLIDPRRQTLIQIDVEPRNAGWTFPIDHPLVGDAATVLGKLVEELSDIDRKQEGIDRVARLRGEFGYFEHPAYDSDDNPINVMRLIGELRRNLPENAILTTDAGENRIFMTRYYQTREGDEFIGTGTGPMGYAVPAAMAAQLAHPDRAAVAVCSDGGFAMSMNGLLNAREENIPVTVVVMNNAYLGMSLRRAKTDYSTFLGHFDYAQMAESMGCRGIRVTDPNQLAAAIREGVNDPRPVVIDVVMSTTMSYLDFEVKVGASAMYGREEKK